MRRVCFSLQNLDWEYFWPHFEKQKMAATGVSLSVIKSAYISLIIGPRVLGGKPT